MRELSRGSWLIIATVVVLFLVSFVIWPAWGYHLDWTGLGASRSPVKNPKALFDYYPSKTLWDWMQILGIPFAVVVVGYLLNRAQQTRETDIANKNRAQDLDIATKNREQDLDIATKNREQDLDIATKNREQDLDIATKNREQDLDIAKENRAQDQATAEDRQQESTLGEYLATMTTLLLDKELRKSAEDDEVRAVARVQTLTVLPRLNKDRKGSVVRFLYESRLINNDMPIIAMGLADLGGVTLNRTDLYKVNLSGADLSGATLSSANLGDANLGNANLSGANTTNAWLHGADLSGANLNLAKMAMANLHVANLRVANLGAADLWGVNFSEADLSGADLRDANLRAANLNGANLAVADLRGLRGKTTGELESAAASLTGATMPDGSTHP